MMKISEVIQILSAEVIWGDEKLCEREVQNACGSDLMSDVLAYVKDQSLLLTGLVNPQVIRTAEMMDFLCIAFVRGKRPDDAMIQLASEYNIVLISTEERMFSACGKLYAAGLLPVPGAGGRLFPGRRGLQYRQEPAQTAGSKP